MTERSGNPPASSSAPLDDATVVIAPAGQPAESSSPVAPAPAPIPDSSTTDRREASSPLTVNMTRSTLSATHAGPPDRSPLWAIVLGVLSGLLLFALTAALLMNR